MKLAEALMERADLQKRIAQMGNRLRSNARVQEGEIPAEDPQALLAELSALSTRLEVLVAQINLTNSQVLVEGESLTLLLARRDAWRQHISLLREFLNTASALTDRTSRSEIKIVSTVNVRDMQKELDQRSTALRRLDAKIQAANWTSELEE